MNQRPQGLNVQKAITGFLQYKSAEGLAPVTVVGIWIEGRASSASILRMVMAAQPTRRANSS